MATDVNEAEAPYLVRKFSVEEFEINKDELADDIDPLLDHLEWDLYDVRAQHFDILQQSYPAQAQELQLSFPDYYSGKIDFTQWVSSAVRCVSSETYERIALIAPFRKRAMSQFHINFNSHDLTIEKIQTGPYIQPDMGKYRRSLPRSYPESLGIAEHPSILKIVREFAMLINHARTKTKMLLVRIHPTSVICRPGQQSKPSLEGVHSDGADYIISALVISRKGILGGESIVYDTDRKKELLRTYLRPGEGIFQDDRHLFHDVTPIAKRPSFPGPEGVRNMIGFDFLIEDGK